MLFRNDLKELMISLMLTKYLEVELEKQGALGNSLSDKIKSYEILTEKDFTDAYNFREYKRKLLNGYYNDLRWASHERNQIMHKDNYYISNFTKFKRVLSKPVKYFENKDTKNFFGTVKQLYVFFPERKNIILIVIFLIFSISWYFLSLFFAIWIVFINLFIYLVISFIWKKAYEVRIMIKNLFIFSLEFVRNIPIFLTKNIFWVFFSVISGFIFDLKINFIF